MYQFDAFDLDQWEEVWGLPQNEIRVVGQVSVHHGLIWEFGLIWDSVGSPPAAMMWCREDPSDTFYKFQSCQNAQDNECGNAT